MNVSREILYNDYINSNSVRNKDMTWVSRTFLTNRESQRGQVLIFLAFLRVRSGGGGLATPFRLS